MFADQGGGNVFDHYASLRSRFDRLEATELAEKQRRVDRGFLEQGITFTVYGDDQGTGRIFPFDLIPQIIPDEEWLTIEEGLAQRTVALNLFLHDNHHEGRMLEDGIIPTSAMEIFVKVERLKENHTSTLIREPIRRKTEISLTP